MRLDDISDTFKYRGSIWVIRCIGIVCLFWIVFGSVLGIDKYVESFFTIDLLIKLLPIGLWAIIEIVNRVPSTVEKSLTAEYKLKSVKSKKIKEEIEEKFKNSRKIRVFAYTAETLGDYLEWHDVRYMDKEVEIQLLCRNWNVERKDQEEYNKKNRQVISGEKRPWYKADVIKAIAYQFKGKFAGTKVKLNQRFYDFPPFYEGYIFDDKEAYIGEYEWLKDPPEGGSQYKRYGGPLTYYSDETELGKKRIRVIISRFEHLWENSKTCNQVETKG